MPALEYLDQVRDEGVPCPKCGQRAGKAVGDADSVDPEQFAAEMNAIQSVDEASSKSKEIQSKLESLEADIAAAESAGDATKAEELRKELLRQRARMKAVYARWEELLRP